MQAPPPTRDEEDIAGEVDPDAVAYIRAKKHTKTLHQAKKMEKAIK